MLKRERPKELPATLTVKGQGESVKFDITYHNRSITELQEVLDGCEADASPVVLFLVKEWDTEYPLTTEGVLEMESDRPGITMAVIAGYHEARHVQKVKN